MLPKPRLLSQRETMVCGLQATTRPITAESNRRNARPFKYLSGIMSQTHVLRDKTELPNGERKEATDTMAGDTSISAAPLEHGGQPEVC